jgi:hypothetical protein
MTLAVCARVLQFTAGPNEYLFHACAEHRPVLEAGSAMCFFATDAEPMRDVDTDDEAECDFCREG